MVLLYMMVRLIQYKKKYPDFSEALKKGREVVDYQVENALLKSALEGNTTAQIFWLKNRRKQQWRDKVEYENTGENKNGVMDELVEALKNVKKD